MSVSLLCVGARQDAIRYVILLWRHQICAIALEVLPFVTKHTHSIVGCVSTVARRCKSFSACVRAWARAWVGACVREWGRGRWGGARWASPPEQRHSLHRPGQQ